jgi:hypothetical protein
MLIYGAFSLITGNDQLNEEGQIMRTIKPGLFIALAVFMTISSFGFSGVLAKATLTDKDLKKPLAGKRIADLVQQIKTAMHTAMYIQPVIREERSGVSSNKPCIVLLLHKGRSRK